MKKEIQNIHIGEVGALDINLPLIKCGSGRPRILLLCGIHGDETSGLFVVRKLLENLELEAGELRIIPAANPLAQALNRRETPTDSQNLNRTFPGEVSKEGLTERLATAIFNEAKECDLVIDLHTFEDSCPVVGISMGQGSEEIKKKSREAIKAFNPDLVWELKPDTKREAHFSGALGIKLAEAGVPNFAAELPEHFRITEKQLERITNGLTSVLSLFGLTTPKNGIFQKKISIFERRVVVSDRAGLFIPQKELMGDVSEGEMVGNLVSIRDFESAKVTSPLSGSLMTLKDKSLVSTGDVLFSVGTKTGEM